THVSHMTGGDFHSNEKSVTIGKPGNVRIELVTAGGTKVLKEKTPVQAGEVIDGTVMSVSALTAFIEREIEDAKRQGVLFSLHLKATMMKVSDPIIFGHAVKVYFADLFARCGDALRCLGANPNDGLAAILKASQSLSAGQQAAVNEAIESAYDTGPPLAMV